LLDELLLKMPYSAQLLFLALIFPLTLSLSIARGNHEHDDTPGPIIKHDGVTYVGVTDSYYGLDIWRGIPYAKPPGRLQPAELIQQQPGTVIARDFGSQCFQLGSAHVNQSEDCLFLNIYRPTQASLKGHHDLDDLPVMFWIHGGGFNSGSSDIYKAESLTNRSAELESPTIFVTINYRLSFFGFSGTFDPYLYEQ
jgi:carboxylesterase type B